jgi:hypothetical protein
MMKKIIVVASAVLSLGMGSAFAQGLPAGSVPPVYGSHAFPNQPYRTATIYSEIFGHPKSSRAPVERTVERNVTPAKRG